MAMVPDLIIEEAATADLVPYARNSKRHPDWQVKQIASSIDGFGFNDPVGVWTRPDGRLEIVEGHGRVLAAKKLGIERIPIVRLDHLDDDARRAYVHAHNQTGLTSGLDLDVVAMDMEDLPAFDWADFGFERINADAFGTDFELPSGGSTQFKTISLQLSQEQYAILVDSLSAIDRESCRIPGGNEWADKVVEAVSQWAER